MHKTAGVNQRALFEDVAAPAMSVGSALHACMGTLLTDHGSSRALGRALSIDKMLAWQAFTIATAHDPGAILAALPGKPGLDTVLAALRKAGCETSAVEAALESIDSALAQRNLTRGQIRSMAVGGGDADSRRRTEMRLHRQAFKANAAIRGAWIAGRIGAMMVSPGSRADVVSVTALTLVHGLVRSVAMGPIPVYAPLVTVPDGDADGRKIGTASGHPSWCRALVPSLCSLPLSPGEVTMIKVFGSDAVLVDPDPHRRSALDLAFAECIRDAGPARQTLQSKEALWVMPLALPMEMAVLDVLVHSSLAEVAPRAFQYFSMTPAQLPSDQPELLRYPVELEAGWVRSGRLPRRLSGASATYDRLLEHGASIAGCPLREFRQFRVQQEYPPTPTSLVVRWQLPE